MERASRHVPREEMSALANAAFKRGAAGDPLVMVDPVSFAVRRERSGRLAPPSEPRARA